MRRSEKTRSPAVMQPLEGRTLFAAAPTDLLSKAVRQELLNHWVASPIKDVLQSKLDTNKIGAFDGWLLDYMANRPGNTFFWNTGDVAGIKNYINSKLDTSTLVGTANAVVNHMVTDGTGSAYDVPLGPG